MTTERGNARQERPSEGRSGAGLGGSVEKGHLLQEKQIHSEIPGRSLSQTTSHLMEFSSCRLGLQALKQACQRSVPSDECRSCLVPR